MSTLIPTSNSLVQNHNVAHNLEMELEKEGLNSVPNLFFLKGFYCLRTAQSHLYRDVVGLFLLRISGKRYTNQELFECFRLY